MKTQEEKKGAGVWLGEKGRRGGEGREERGERTISNFELIKSYVLRVSDNQDDHVSRCNFFF